MCGPHRETPVSTQPEAKGVAIQDVKDYMTAFVDLGDKAEYIHLLEHELEQERWEAWSGLLMGVELLVWVRLKGLVGEGAKRVRHL